MDAGNDVLFVFQLGVFGGNKAKNDLLFSDVAQRFKAACAVAVILQEETVYIALTEQDLSYRLVSAGGGPGGAEVAAADVHGNGHIFRLCFQHLVEYVDIFASDLIDIDAALGIGFAFLGRAELAPGGIIQLEIATACGIECFYGFLVSCGKII